MEQNVSEKSIISLAPWFDTPAGAYARAWEQARLDELTADIFGYNAVQVGLPQVELRQIVFLHQLDELADLLDVEDVGPGLSGAHGRGWSPGRPTERPKNGGKLGGG